MNQSTRVPPPLPASLSTTDNVAFWGTLHYEQRMIASFDPIVLTFETDLTNTLDFDPLNEPELIGRENICLWGNRMEKRIQFTWEGDLRDKFISRREHGYEYWCAGLAFNMYALIKLRDGDIAMYRVVSGAVDPDCEDTEFLFKDSSCCDNMVRLVMDDLTFTIWDTKSPGFTDEWLDEYLKCDRSMRLEMETAFVNSEANAGRGWNATRQDIIHALVAQLH